jgi:hypothetical protein
LERVGTRIELLFPDLGHRRPLERRASAKQFVEKRAKPVDNVALRGGKPGQFVGGEIAGISHRCLGCHQTVAEAKAMEYGRVGSQQLDALVAVDDDVAWRERDVDKAEIQALLDCLPDPHGEIERADGRERGSQLDEVRQGSALDDFDDDVHLPVVRQTIVDDLSEGLWQIGLRHTSGHDPSETLNRTRASLGEESEDDYPTGSNVFGAIDGRDGTRLDQTVDAVFVLEDSPL